MEQILPVLLILSSQVEQYDCSSAYMQIKKQELNDSIYLSFASGWPWSEALPASAISAYSVELIWGILTWYSS